MRQRKCAFCAADAVERGGEHVWDDWINKALPKTTYRARRRSQDSPLVEYDTDSLNLKLPVVCADCNHGWMSILSSQVKERFGRAMLLAPVNLARFMGSSFLALHMLSEN